MQSPTYAAAKYREKCGMSWLDIVNTRVDCMYKEGTFLHNVFGTDRYLSAKSECYPRALQVAIGILQDKSRIELESDGTPTYIYIREDCATTFFNLWWNAYNKVAYDPFEDTSYEVEWDGQGLKETDIILTEAYWQSLGIYFEDLTTRRQQEFSERVDELHYEVYDHNYKRRLPINFQHSWIPYDSKQCELYRGTFESGALNIYNELLEDQKRANMFHVRYERRKYIYSL